MHTVNSLESNPGTLKAGATRTFRFLGNALTIEKKLKL